MAIDPYASCPCGSGKRFKWCCQPIHAEIDRAFHQDAEGQHEAALKLMEEVVQRYSDNPEAWGRRAQLLYQNGQPEQAEDALQKAFDLSPNYPFGHLLRGLFRYHEGEVAGALLLFRKAADLYAPDALGPLGQAYALIADCELKMNRPVAARAALQIAIRCEPASEELRENLEQIFGKESTLPDAARKEYTFQSPAPGVSGERRTAWDRALGGAGKLSDTARAFGELTAADPADAAAWYNLALVRAWLGENAPALEALDRYIELEADEARAAAAWTLGEVLRLGHGLEEQADCREYTVSYEARDFNPVMALLQEWERDRRLVGVQSNQQEGILSALVLEKPTVLAGGAGGGPPRRLGAYLLILGPLLRLRHPNKAMLDQVNAEVQQRAASGLTPPVERVTPATFSDVVLDAVVFPVGPDREESMKRILEHAQQYFEETWIHKPLKALSGMPPVDAAGHRGLRKKLRGVIDFLQQCSAHGVIQGYDFDRLRRRLGLLEGVPAPAAETGAVGVGDIGAMGAGELAGLQAGGLSPEQLEQAYQSAVRLDAPELAGCFARELIGRPAHAERPDRAPYYFYLTQRALAEGNSDEALNLINEGERVDCEQNEGRRRNDYELRRAQVHMKRGEVDQAQEVFDRLVERDPTNLRARSSAAEAMLSQRQGARALRYAEEGLAQARKQNDRDSEQHFLELVAAARKQAG
jgi:tetratricopeptide (TPR) repeat protein